MPAWSSFKSHPNFIACSALSNTRTRRVSRADGGGLVAQRKGLGALQTTIVQPTVPGNPMSPAIVMAGNPMPPLPAVLSPMSNRRWR